MSLPQPHSHTSRLLSLDPSCPKKCGATTGWCRDAQTNVKRLSWPMSCLGQTSYSALENIMSQGHGRQGWVPFYRWPRMAASMCQTAEPQEGTWPRTAGVGWVGRGEAFLGGSGLCSRKIEKARTAGDRWVKRQGPARVMWSEPRCTRKLHTCQRQPTILGLAA